MKYSAEDLAALRDAIEPVLNATPITADDYRARGLSPQRFRWDVLWRAVKPDTDLMRRVLKYADAHTDTALRRIVGEASGRRDERKRICARYGL